MNGILPGPPTADGQFVVNFTRGSIQPAGLAGLFDIDAWAHINLSFNGNVSLPFAGSWEVGLVQYLASTTHRQQYDNGGFIFLSSAGFWLDTLDSQPDMWITPPGPGMGVFSLITSGPFVVNPISLSAQDDPTLVLPVLEGRNRCSTTVSETLLWVYHNMFFRAFVVARVDGMLNGTAFPLLMSDIYGFELLFDATHPQDADQDPYLTFQPTAGSPQSIQPSEFLAFSPYNTLSLAPPDPFRANSVLGGFFTQAVSQYLGDCNTYMGPFDPASMGIMGISLPGGT